MCSSEWKSWNRELGEISSLCYSKRIRVVENREWDGEGKQFHIKVNYSGHRRESLVLAGTFWEAHRMTPNAICLSHQLLFSIGWELPLNDSFPMFWRPSCCYKGPLCRRSLKAENEVLSAHDGRPCQLKVNLGLRGLHWYHLPRSKESEKRPIWCSWTTVILGPIDQLFNNLGTFCLCCSVCPTFGNAMDCDLPSSSAHGIFQARILESVAIFFRRSSQPRDRTPISYAVIRFFTVWVIREDSHLFMTLCKCKCTLCKYNFQNLLSFLL